MSALTKPFVHTVDTISGIAEPVNAEKVLHFESRDINGEYQIYFKMGDYPRDIVWKYAASATRDTDYAAVLAAVSADVTP